MRTKIRSGARFLAAALYLALPACAGIGPARLPSDHLDYARAISEAQKRQTLLNIVRLRYGDAPTFLTVSQVISSYTLERSAELGLNAFPSARNNNVATALASLGYSDHPTITFTPLNGEELAQISIRPPSPADLLPLAQSGLPIDVLFRLAVQSVGPLQNTVVLAGPASRGSPEFFDLIAGLRRLQERGLLTVRFVHGKTGNHVFLSLADGTDPAMRRIAAQTRRLLGMAPAQAEGEVVYGRVASAPNQIPILTRPVVAILSQISAGIEVPAQDVAAGRTVASLPAAQMGMKPAIIIHSVHEAPANAYTAARYQDTWFWIDNDDFNSKVAYTILQLLIALVESNTAGRGPVLTIPAG